MAEFVAGVSDPAEMFGSDQSGLYATHLPESTEFHSNASYANPVPSLAENEKILPPYPGGHNVRTLPPYPHDPGFLNPVSLDDSHLKAKESMSSTESASESSSEMSDSSGDSLSYKKLDSLPNAASTVVLEPGGPPYPGLKQDLIQQWSEPTPGTSGPLLGIRPPALVTAGTRTVNVVEIHPEGKRNEGTLLQTDIPLQHASTSHSESVDRDNIVYVSGRRTWKERMLEQQADDLATGVHPGDEVQQLQKASVLDFYVSENPSKSDDAINGAELPRAGLDAAEGIPVISENIPEDEIAVLWTDDSRNIISDATIAADENQNIDLWPRKDTSVASDKVHIRHMGNGVLTGNTNGGIPAVAARMGLYQTDDDNYGNRDNRQRTSYHGGYHQKARLKKSNKRTVTNPEILEPIPEASSLRTRKGTGGIAGHFPHRSVDVVEDRYLVQEKDIAETREQKLEHQHSSRSKFVAVEKLFRRLRDKFSLRRVDHSGSVSGGTYIMPVSEANSSSQGNLLHRLQFSYYTGATVD